MYSILSKPGFTQNPITEAKAILDRIEIIHKAIEVAEGKVTTNRQEAYDLYRKTGGVAKNLGGGKLFHYLGHLVLEIVINVTVSELKSAESISEELKQFVGWELSADLATGSRHGSRLPDHDRHKLIAILLDGILYIKDRAIREKLFEEITYRLVENTDPDGKTVVDQDKRIDFLRRHNMTNSNTLRQQGWT